MTGAPFSPMYVAWEVTPGRAEIRLMGAVSDSPGQAAGHVDERVADPAGAQVTPVRGGRPLGPGQRGQGHRPEQADEQG